MSLFYEGMLGAISISLVIILSLVIFLIHTGYYTLE